MRMIQSQNYNIGIMPKTPLQNIKQIKNTNKLIINYSRPHHTQENLKSSQTLIKPEKAKTTNCNKKESPPISSFKSGLFLIWRNVMDNKSTNIPQHDFRGLSKHIKRIPIHLLRVVFAFLSPKKLISRTTQGNFPYWCIRTTVACRDAN